MPFAYYSQLSRRQQGIYRQSDKLPYLKLSNVDIMRAHADVLANVLEAGQQRDVEQACRQLAGSLLEKIGAPPVRIKLGSVRPCNDDEELHGYYEPVDGRQRARITLWMRTAKRKQRVAFRSFLRTLLHELCHHLDYEYYGLEDSFHTEGFYRRESVLFKQLLPA